MDPPRVDVNVEVCFIPGLASAEIFVALARSDDLTIFEHRVVSCLIQRGWWEVAYTYDILQLFLTGWFLLVLTAWSLTTMNFEEELEVVEAEIPLIRTRSFDFVAARALADLILAFVEVVGDSRLRFDPDRSAAHQDGETTDESSVPKTLRYMLRWFRRGSFQEFWSVLILVSMFFLPVGRLKSACKGFAMLWYWWGFLGISTRCAQKVATFVCPMIEASYSLIPPLMVTSVIFCGLWQAIDLLITELEPASHNDDIFMKLFYFSWAVDPERTFAYKFDDPVLRGSMYMTTLLFSVYILNIFIGIISEAYKKETETVDWVANNYLRNF